MTIYRAWLDDSRIIEVEADSEQEAIIIVSDKIRLENCNIEVIEQLDK